MAVTGGGGKLPPLTKSHMDELHERLFDAREQKDFEREKELESEIQTIIKEWMTDEKISSIRKR